MSASKVDHKEFLELGVEILGISADSSFSQKTFAASLGLPYPLLSDFPDLQTILSYGVDQRVGKIGRVFAKSSWFLVDRQGIVRGRWILDDNLATQSTEPILKMAREIQAER